MKPDDPQHHAGLPAHDPRHHAARRPAVRHQRVRHLDRRGRPPGDVRPGGPEPRPSPRRPRAAPCPARRDPRARPPRRGPAPRRATYAQVAQNAGRLAAALARLGIKPGDPVATFCWNNTEHLEAYFGVPSMGAVLHTLNIRLPGAQVAQIVNHAADRIIIVDVTLSPLLSKIAGELPTVEAFIVNGSGDASALEGSVPVLRYHELLAAEP